MNRPQTVREQADRLFALLRHAGRFYRTGLLFFLVGCAAALVVAVKQPRVYRSEALILYRQRISDTALGRDEATEGARRIGLRLREVVLSRSRLERIINELKLYPDLVEDRGIAEAVDLMRQKVNFKAREGDTYALSFEGNDPAMTQKVTQRLTDILKAENERSAVEVAAGTKEFLDAESQRVDEELKKRESRLAKFLAEHPAFAAEAARSAGGGMMNVSAPEAGTVKKSPSGGGGRRRSSDPRIEALEREAERIQARLSPSPPPSPSLSPEAKEAADEWNRRKAEATRELEAAQRDLQDKRQSFTDEHPDVKRAKGRVEAALRVLDEVQLKGMRDVARMQGRTPPVLQPLTPDERQRLQDELTRIQTDIGKYRASARRSADSDREAPAPAISASSEADNIVKLETTWVQLNREVTETREQKNQVEARRFTADIRERLTQSEGADRMVVIDPPYKPSRPVRGGRTQTAGIGGGIALLLALGLMLLLALLDDRVYDRHDIDRLRLELGPLLTAVPPLSARQRKAQRLAQGALPRPGDRPGKKPDKKADRKAAHG